MEYRSPQGYKELIPDELFVKSGRVFKFNDKRDEPAVSLLRIFRYAVPTHNAVMTYLTAQARALVNNETSSEENRQQDLWKILRDKLTESGLELLAGGEDKGLLKAFREHIPEVSLEAGRSYLDVLHRIMPAKVFSRVTASKKDSRFYRTLLVKIESIGYAARIPLSPAFELPSQKTLRYLVSQEVTFSRPLQIHFKNIPYQEAAKEVLMLAENFDSPQAAYVIKDVSEIMLAEHAMKTVQAATECIIHSQHEAFIQDNLALALKKALGDTGFTKEEFPSCEDPGKN
ncbi:hypothetical protein HYZ97_01195 [Candidatus Pacearchaeota archaeon]|nr:hypothetical protein [Candidatus Pacearchaeota archaeon]